MPEATFAKRDNLALIFQEILTATVRIRADRQAVSDAESFRAHILEAIRIAEREARARGYAPEDFRNALFAIVVFLDESILSSRSTLFSGWARKPLQDEIFGGHVGGEVFYQNVDKLLAASDSSALADILEVYHLCLLLGYLGRYGASGKGDLRGIRDSIGERIERIRGVPPDLSPSWMPPLENAARVHRDSWAKRLVFAAALCCLLAVTLFIGFRLSLDGQLGQVTALAEHGEH